MRSSSSRGLLFSIEALTVLSPVSMQASVSESTDSHQNLSCHYHVQDPHLPAGQPGPATNCSVDALPTLFVLLQIPVQPPLL